MSMMGPRKTRKNTKLATLLGGLAIAWGCGGLIGSPVTGGESHFLRACVSECSSGLECIAGVCTEECIVGGATCANLDANASCTGESVESGSVGVCDVECRNDGDCASLGSTHTCVEGFCRGALASVGSGAAGASGSAGATSNPDDSVVAGFDSTISYGERVAQPCPAGVTSPDAITILSSRFLGDTLELEVGHGGGCAEHTYALCYDSTLLTSYPVQGRLILLHDANGDTCEAYLQPTLQFDLEPYAAYYRESFGAEGGIIETTLGTYAFGTLDCEARELAATQQVQDAIAQLDLACVDHTDCGWAPIDTACSASCGTTVSFDSSSDQTLATTLEAIGTHTCGDYEAAGCGPVIVPPCASPAPVVCQAGRCVQTEG